MAEKCRTFLARYDEDVNAYMERAAALRDLRLEKIKRFEEAEKQAILQRFEVIFVEKKQLFLIEISRINICFTRNFLLIIVSF